MDWKDTTFTMPNRDYNKVYQINQHRALNYNCSKETNKDFSFNSKPKTKTP